MCGFAVFVLHDSKLRILWFWTVSRSKGAVLTGPLNSTDPNQIKDLWDRLRPMEAPSPNMQNIPVPDTT